LCNRHDRLGWFSGGYFSAGSINASRNDFPRGMSRINDQCATENNGKHCHIGEINGRNGGRPANNCSRRIEFLVAAGLIFRSSPDLICVVNARQMRRLRAGPQKRAEKI
jgi:hypothetical protein